MSNDEDKTKSQSLVKYEPQQSLALVDRFELYAEKKKRELREALERGDVADPITATLVGWGLSTAWASAATSAILMAASVGVSLAMSALTPGQKLLEERGRRTGDQVINAELGILIPEIYAADLSEAQPLRSIWSLCTRQR